MVQPEISIILSEINKVLDSKSSKKIVLKSIDKYKRTFLA